MSPVPVLHSKPHTQRHDERGSHWCSFLSLLQSTLHRPIDPFPVFRSYIPSRANDHRPILHISSYTYHQREWFAFCDIFLSVTCLTYLSFIQYWNAVKSSYFWDLTTLLNGKATLRWKGHKVRSQGTKMQKKICAYLCEKWVDLHRNKPKWSSPCSTYLQRSKFWWRSF